MDKKTSNKALHTLDPENPVFLKHVIVNISVFPKWDHLKKIWFIMKMESIKRITFYWNSCYIRYLNIWEIQRMQYMYISHNLSFSKHYLIKHRCESAKMKNTFKNYSLDWSQNWNIFLVAKKNCKKIIGIRRLD